MTDTPKMAEYFIRQIVFGGAILMMAAVVALATYENQLERMVVRGWYEPLRQPAIMCTLNSTESRFTQLSSSQKR